MSRLRIIAKPSTTANKIREFRSPRPMKYSYSMSTITPMSRTRRKGFWSSRLRRRKSESKTLKMKVKELPLLRNHQRKDAGGQESRSTKVMLRKRSRPQKVAADQRKLLREMLRNHRTNQVKNRLKTASSLMSSSTIQLKWSPKRTTRREELNQLLDLKAAKRKVRINLHRKKRSRKLSQKRRNRNLHQNRRKLRLKRKLKRQFLKIQMQRC